MRTEYSEDDKELPYDFDLLFDIKTIGQLKWALEYDHIYNPTKDIEVLMKELNITIEEIE